MKKLLFVLTVSTTSSFGFTRQDAKTITIRCAQKDESHFPLRFAQVQATSGEGRWVSVVDIRDLSVYDILYELGERDVAADHLRIMQSLREPGQTNCVTYGPNRGSGSITCELGPDSTLEFFLRGELQKVVVPKSGQISVRALGSTEGGELLGYTHLDLLSQDEVRVRQTYQFNEGECVVE